jgi:hypothetical protein
MTDFKRVLNTAPRSVSIIYNGKLVSLAPGESEVDEALANAFISESPHVFNAEEEVGILREAFAAPAAQVCIANMTGNPDAPDTVKVKAFINKQWTLVDAPNPLKQSRTLKKEMKGAMREQMNKFGNVEGVNDFGRSLTIPRYTRVFMSKADADWWMSREYNRSPEYRGESILSRPPSSFEPNMNWSLSDMRLYLKVVDPDAKEIPTDDEARTQAVKNLQAEYRKMHDKSVKASDPALIKFVDNGLQRELHKAKKEAMIRLFFRLADPQYKLPTRQQFEELKSGVKELAPVIDEDEINSVLDAISSNQAPSLQTNG